MQSAMRAASFLATTTTASETFGRMAGTVVGRGLLSLRRRDADGAALLPIVPDSIRAPPRPGRVPGCGGAARRGAVPGRDLGRWRDPVADRGGALPRRGQEQPVALGDHPCRSRAKRRLQDRRRRRHDARRDEPAEDARVAPARRRRARRRLGDAPGRRPLRHPFQALGRGQGQRTRWPEQRRRRERAAPGGAPHRRLHLREADRRRRACSRPASPTSPGPERATRCASPTPTARTARSRSTAASRSFRRPGRRTARSSPTSRSSVRRRSSSSTTSPAASAARSPISAARTAPRRGRPTASGWR